ncbi:MAG: hypothetical protein KUL83_09830 [Lentimicrobium sp.]|nr:hypothetical protein [Lentimicrobium sp.]MDD2528504.1 hypothetical protein [Lentimicrobiaceae bacterium]MDD4598391.1 hypothetical protein [Lentimicrobiaceae bacterium]MDY0026639.1 hypothetical protein [Lentimicrobium sp.]
MFRAHLFIILILLSAGTALAQRKNANADNSILVANKKYLYEECYRDSSKSSKFYVVLSSFEEPKFNQTLIKYTYYSSLDSVLQDISYYWEETLAEESQKWFALHPPRALLNEINQILPFPEIKLKKSIGYRWKETLTGMKGWDNYPKNLVVKSFYTIEKDSIIDVMGNNSVLCRKVSTFSTSKIGKGKSVFYYNHTYGFVLIENKINDVKLTMKLLRVLK